MPVDESKVNAIFKNGVLSISIPKAEASKGIYVPIKTA
jgi:HSP20 family molecular chaperone IbpA